MADPGRMWRRRSVLTAFGVIFLAEWGDLTQVLTVNLAARYHAPLAVAVGALLAMASVAGIAVAGGQGLLRLVNVTIVRLLTAGVLLILGGYAAYTAFG